MDQKVDAHARKRLDNKRLTRWMGGTIIVLMIGAAIGGLIGEFLEFSAGLYYANNVVGVNVFYQLPSIIAAAGVQATWIVILVPLWTLVGGWMFAFLLSDKTGSIARNLKVTFLPEGHPIYEKVQELARELGLPTVRYVGHFEEHSINAFACGQSRHNAMVAFSRACIEKTTGDQFEAIVAHELAHVASNDMARMTLAYGTREALTFFLIFQGLKVLVRNIFTFVSELEIKRFSREREYYADAVAAVLTSPEAMIGVLNAIGNDTGKPQYPATKYASLMFFGLGNTHPPLRSRIKALEDQSYMRRLPFAD